jgi:hypothetical protein
MKTSQYYNDCLILGDGQKYIFVNDEYIPFVSCSRIDRLKQGDKCNIIVEIDDNGEKVADWSERRSFTQSVNK